jgi:hypothetical protein
VCYEYSRSVSVIFLKDVEVVDKVSRLIKVEEHGLVSGKGIIFLIFGRWSVEWLQEVKNWSQECLVQRRNICNLKKITKLL